MQGNADSLSWKFVLWTQLLTAAGSELRYCGYCDVPPAYASKQASVHHYAAPVVLKRQRLLSCHGSPRQFNTTKVLDQWCTHAQRVQLTNSACLKHADCLCSTRLQGSIRSRCNKPQSSKLSLVMHSDSLPSCAQRQPRQEHHARCDRTLPHSTQ